MNLWYFAQSLRDRTYRSCCHLLNVYELMYSTEPRLVWLGGVAVGRRIRDREVTSLVSGCSAARCNSGQVVHTYVPLFTKQYKLVPASAGV